MFQIWGKDRAFRRETDPDHTLKTLTQKGAQPSRHGKAQTHRYRRRSIHVRTREVINSPQRRAVGTDSVKVGFALRGSLTARNQLYVSNLWKHNHHFG
jgi:hypothetical protein